MAMSAWSRFWRSVSGREGERGQLAGRGEGSWGAGTGSQGWQTTLNATLKSIGCVA